jgi:enterochelin esterase-like enzyme
MKVNIYLPKGYSNNVKYPVLYLIHGYTANVDTWMPRLETDKKADDLIEKNEIEPLIIVAPQIDDSYGINSAKVPGEIGSPSEKYNTGMYEDYFCKELIPYIDKNYSTISTKEGRYLGGMSMGGWTALYLAFTHTDLFSKVGGHSPAIFLDGYPGTAMTFVYPNEELRNQRDPIRLAQKKDLTGLKIYLDCGDQDHCTLGCEKLYDILKSKGADSQYHVYKGDHNDEYWGANVENYLKFYAGK